MVLERIGWQRSLAGLRRLTQVQTQAGCIGENAEALEFTSKTSTFVMLSRVMSSSTSSTSSNSSKFFLQQSLSHFSSKPDSSEGVKDREKEDENNTSSDNASSSSTSSSGKESGSGDRSSGDDAKAQWDTFVNASKEKSQDFFKQGSTKFKEYAKDANTKNAKQQTANAVSMLSRFSRLVKEELKDMFDMKESEGSTTRKRPDLTSEDTEYTGTTDLTVGKNPEKTGWSKKWDEVKGQAKTHAFFQKVLGLKEHKMVQKANEMAEDLRDRWETSDSRFVHSIQDKLQETEYAGAMKEIRVRDPGFDMIMFLRDIKSDIVPVMNAYLKGDLTVLKDHASKEVCERVEAQQRFLKQEGAVLDSRILDIKEVHLFDVKSFENSPLIIIRFALQQIKCVRDKYGNILEGGMDEIQAVDYLWALQQENNGTYEKGKFLPPRWVLRECQAIQELKQIV